MFTNGIALFSENNKNYEWIVKAKIDTPENRRIIDNNSEKIIIALNQIQIRSWDTGTLNSELNQNVFNRIVSFASQSSSLNLQHEDQSEEKTSINNFNLSKEIERNDLLKIMTNYNACNAHRGPDWTININLFASNPVSVTHSDNIIFTNESLFRLTRYLYKTLFNEDEITQIQSCGAYGIENNSEAIAAPQRNIDPFENIKNETRALAIKIFGQECHETLYNCLKWGYRSDLEIQTILSAPEHNVDKVWSAFCALKNREHANENWMPSYLKKDPTWLANFSHVKLLCHYAPSHNLKDLRNLSHCLTWLENASIATKTNQNRACEIFDKTKNLDDFYFSQNASKELKQTVFDATYDYVKEKVSTYQNRI